MTSFPLIVCRYGQAYTALSRVRSLEGLSLKSGDLSRITVHPKVKLFYKELRERQATPPEQQPRKPNPFYQPSKDQPSKDQPSTRAKRSDSKDVVCGFQRRTKQKRLEKK